jgi:hypothetical protein
MSKELQASAGLMGLGCLFILIPFFLIFLFIAVLFIAAAIASL